VPPSQKPAKRPLTGKKTLGVRLDQPDLEAVQRLARSAGLTPSDFVREVIKERVGKASAVSPDARLAEMQRTITQLRHDLATVARFVVLAQAKTPPDSPEFSAYDQELETELKRLLGLK
jgi:hypothetical protein